MMDDEQRRDRRAQWERDRVSRVQAAVASGEYIGDMKAEALAWLGEKAAQREERMIQATEASAKAAKGAMWAAWAAAIATAVLALIEFFHK
jgi:hypothetical protein